LNYYSLWHNTSVWRTDAQTDRIAVANTALEACKMKRRLVKHRKFQYSGRCQFH